MNIRRYSNMTILFFLAVLIVFSIQGAFYGAERAQFFFNSLPMVIFWSVLLAFFVIGFFIYLSLRKRLGLLLIHAGCVLVLIGGMYGSEKAHQLSGRLFQKETLTKGSMSLQEGQSSSHVAIEQAEQTRHLPFTIRLEEAFIEYYDEPFIRLSFSGQTYIDLPLEVGKLIEISERGTVQVVRAYRNFKMKQVDGSMIPYDATEPGYNPAYELMFIHKDGTTESFFVFEQFPMHSMPDRSYHAEYIAPRMTKDYKSHLQVIENGKVIKEKMIEVNKPLYYGGYHFYQNTFGYTNSGPVSGILVSSARGVWVVFLGYAMIFFGLIIQLWPKLLRKNRYPERSEEVAMNHAEAHSTGEVK